jgi:hypothetical protein
LQVVITAGRWITARRTRRRVLEKNNVGRPQTKFILIFLQVVISGPLDYSSPEVQAGLEDHIGRPHAKIIHYIWHVLISGPLDYILLADCILKLS